MRFLELLDLTREIERYLITKGLDSSKISVKGFLEALKEDRLEEL